MSRDQIQKQPRVRASLLVSTRRCHTLIHMHIKLHAPRHELTHMHIHTHTPTPTHKLRFSLAENQQFCPFCVDTTEDKCHVQKFHLPLYRGLPRNECYSRLCSDSNNNKLLNVSRFIFFALTLRESLIKSYRLLCVRMDP